MNGRCYSMIGHRPHTRLARVFIKNARIYVFPAAIVKNVHGYKVTTSSSYFVACYSTS